MKETQVRSAAAFKRTETVKLPSGIDIEMRKPDASRLVMEAPEDSVPRFLVAQFAGAIGSNVSSDSVQDTPTEALNKMSRFMDRVVKHAVVWPVIVDKPTTDNEIALSDFSMEERQFIFTWAMPQAEAK